MDYHFEHEIEVAGMCAGTGAGTCYVEGFADDWHVARIRIEACRMERGATVWRDVPLPAHHYLHPEILSFLEHNCKMDIEEKLCDAGRTSVHGVADPNAEHRLSAFELLGA